ncbi:hypothetical protein [Neokomagataea tanensis]|uniref:hypothetical protein n=1 Tax=Neokomagataea TaxID=1223423 RepID=UPI0014775BA7|nr:MULTISPECIES: hypothetical protein [Neokomagataea]
MPLAFVYLAGAVLAALVCLIQPDATPLMLLLGKFMLTGCLVTAIFEIFTLSRKS